MLKERIYIKVTYTSTCKVRFIAEETLPTFLLTSLFWLSVLISAWVTKTHSGP